MNAVERIEAAIQKLEGQKAAADQGRWSTGWDGQEFYIAGSDAKETWAGYKDRVAEATYAIHPGSPEDMAECNTANFDLIVTLHRTIDAQVAFLRDQARRMRFEINQAGIPLHYRSVIVLADAILGEVAS